MVAFGKQDVLEPRLRRGRGRGARPRLRGGQAPRRRARRGLPRADGRLRLGRAELRSLARHARSLPRRSPTSIERALRTLGVDARIGEVPGEYCPGDYSINARGETKLAGLGQRIIKGASHIGGVIVVGGAGRMRDVLVPVYEALGLDWDPGTTGSIEDEVRAGRVRGRGRGDPGRAAAASSRRSSTRETLAARRAARARAFRLTGHDRPPPSRSATSSRGDTS